MKWFDQELQSILVNSVGPKLQLQQHCPLCCHSVSFLMAPPMPLTKPKTLILSTLLSYHSPPCSVLMLVPPQPSPTLPSYPSPATHCPSQLLLGNTCGFYTYLPLQAQNIGHKINRQLKAGHAVCLNFVSNNHRIFAFLKEF